MCLYLLASVRKHDLPDFIGTIWTRAIRHIHVYANCLAPHSTNVSIDNHEKFGRGEEAPVVLEGIHNKCRRIMTEQKEPLVELLMSKELLSQPAHNETADWYCIKFLHSGS